MIGEVKRCVKCASEWPASVQYFYVRSAAPDGLDDRCKACWRARRAEMRWERKLQFTTGLPIR